MPSIVVSNASPLILLSAVGQFGRLQDLFGEVSVSTQVLDEVVIQGRGRPGAAEAATAGFLRKAVVFEPDRIQDLVRRESLAEGEASTIVLALELKADLVLIDEKAGRRVAKDFGLKVAGTLRVLEFAHERGFLENLRESYARLKSGPAWIAPALLDASLVRFGLPPLS